MACSTRALIGSHQFGAGQDVAFHRLLQRSLGGLAQIGQYRTQGVEFVEIAMPANRRTGTAIAGAAPVVQPLPGPRRQSAGSDSCREAGRGGRNVVQHQWTQVMRGAAGSGASGSSTIRARLLASAGRPDQRSSGDRSWPSQVRRTGIAPLWANAGEVSVKVIGGPLSLAIGFQAIRPAGNHALFALAK